MQVVPNPRYDLRMITALKNMLPQIDRWPSEDQEALLEAARSIEAERAGIYHASEAEPAAIDGGLDDAGQAASRPMTRQRRFERNSAANDPSVDRRRIRRSRINSYISEAELAGDARALRGAADGD